MIVVCSYTLSSLVSKQVRVHGNYLSKSNYVPPKRTTQPTQEAQQDKAL